MCKILWRYVTLQQSHTKKIFPSNLNYDGLFVHEIGSRSHLCIYIYSAEDKPKFMGHSPDHPCKWWKTVLPKSFLGCPNYFDLSLKEIVFLIINTKRACFRWIMFPLIESWAIWGTCWIARPSNGSHLATGQSLIHSTVYMYMGRIGHCLHME